MKKYIYILFLLPICYGQIRSLNGSLQNSQRVVWDTTSSRNTFTITTSNGVHTLWFPYSRFALTGSGGSVGNADSLGSHPASYYAVKADSTIVAVNAPLTLSRANHTTTLSFAPASGSSYDTSRLFFIDKINTVTATPQIFSAVKFDTVSSKTPSGNVVVNDSFTVTGITTTAQIIANDSAFYSTSIGAQLERYGSAVGVRLDFKSAKGSRSSPTGIVANDVLGLLSIRGYTSANAFTSSLGFIRTRSLETWTSTANGYETIIENIFKGGTSVATRFKADTLTRIGGGYATIFARADVAAPSNTASFQFKPQSASSPYLFENLVEIYRSSSTTPIAKIDSSGYGLFKNYGSATIPAGDTISVYIFGLTTATGHAVATYNSSTFFTPDTVPMWWIPANDTLRIRAKYNKTVSFWIGRK